MPQSKSWGFPRWGGYGKDTEAVTVRTCEWDGCEEIRLATNILTR